MKLAVLQTHWHIVALLESPMMLPVFEVLVTQSRLVSCLQVGVVAWVQGLGWGGKIRKSVAGSSFWAVLLLLTPLHLTMKWPPRSFYCGNRSYW